MSTEQADRTGATLVREDPGGSYADAAAVLATRPRLRRDVLYTQVPDGVLFHDASTGFRLQSAHAYKFASLVVPYLNGEYLVADLCAGLGETQGRMVVDLARSLLRRGFARDATPADPSGPDRLGDDVRRRYAAQIGYVDHHVDGAEDRFAQFRQTRVAVLGSDEVARWCALSLVRNGAAEVGLDAAADPEGTVAQEARLAGDDSCPVRVRALEGGDPLLGWADLAAYDVVVVTPGAPGRQLVALTDAGVPADATLLPAWLLGDHVVVGPLTRPGARTCWRCALLRLGDNADPAAAARLWRSLVVDGAASRAPSAPLAAMVGNLLGYEVFRLATGALPAETADAVLVQDLDSLDVTREPLLPHPECGHLGPAAPQPEPAVPARVAELTLPPGRHEPGVPVPEPGRPEVEADLVRLDRRQVLVQPRAGVFLRFDDDELTQVPLRVSTVEVALGAGRRRRVAAVDLHHVLGARLAATRAAAAVYARQRAALPTSVGLGVGDDPAQARGAALLSALGFRALDAALRGRAQVRQVRLDRVADDPALTFLARTAAGLGVTAELVELGDPDRAPVPVLLARAVDPVDGTSRWALAADTSWRSAAVVALRDLLGVVQLAAETGRPVDTGDPLVADLDARCLVAGGEADPRPALSTTLTAALDRLAAEGSTALVADLPLADLAAGELYAAHVLLDPRDHDAD